MKAVKIYNQGGPEVMQYEDIALGAPGHGEVRLGQTAIGLNYLDTYHRSGAYLTRPSLMTYVASDDALRANTADLFEIVGSGAVKIEVNQTYALADAAKAHQDLEGRKTTGSTVLLP